MKPINICISIAKYKIQNVCGQKSTSLIYQSDLKMTHVWSSSVFNHWKEYLQLPGIYQNYFKLEKRTQILLAKIKTIEGGN